MGLKQVILVNCELEMGKGKVAVEVAHASLEAYKKAVEKDPETVRKWEDEGAKKVVLRASLKEILEFKEWADRKGLPNALVKDAGRTQVPPGSITALAIGPAREDELQETERLKLL